MSERTKALLSAAATIYAQALVSPAHKDRDGESLRVGAVEAAYRMLDAIEAREKVNAPKSTNYCTCEVIGDNHLCPTHGG